VVKVNGEVMFPTEIVYKEGASIDYYIDKAGGFTENARKKDCMYSMPMVVHQKQNSFIF
jgi:protein involved in polysaccharide export with SLBB domain